MIFVLDSLSQVFMASIITWARFTAIEGQLLILEKRRENRREREEEREKKRRGKGKRKK